MAPVLKLKDPPVGGKYWLNLEVIGFLLETSLSCLIASSGLGFLHLFSEHFQYFMADDGRKSASVSFGLPVYKSFCTVSMVHIVPGRVIQTMEELSP